MIMLVGGVTLNGRSYRQGDTCEFLPQVSVRRRDNSQGSSQSHLIGRINMMYRVPMRKGNDEFSSEVFVSITTIDISAKERSMYITQNVDRQVGSDGFKFVHDHLAHTLVHVDSITSKLMLTPHYDPGLRDTLMCGIRMWHAR